MFDKIKTFIKKYLLMIILSLMLGSITALMFIKKQLQPIPKDKILISQMLNLVDISPKPPVFESTWSTELIKFTFDQPLNPETIKYNIIPQENTRVVFKSDSPNAFAVLPLTGWEENQEYSITVSKDLSSKDGYKLNRDGSVAFTRKLPQDFAGQEECNAYPGAR